ncbi:uncharacterized protein LOC110973254 [Acanthaster planci]|uniref:Uncharacterized protein LOC110973254 n=1 Tax=Acanthaster planci TaxID=133434 RepID=A0A8B7XFT4_ACAPL|nr:uncharacterized protein LOC110973254 [Acanthaster planci]
MCRRFRVSNPPRLISTLTPSLLRIRRPSRPSNMVMRPGQRVPILQIVLTAVTEMTTNEGIESNANAATSALVGISEPPLFPETPCDFWGYHTTDNNYVYVFPFPAFDPAKELYVRFGVRTGMSALLALTLNNQNPTRYEDALYEIVIDYRYSETSGIRRCKDCQNVVSVMDAANRLDDDVYKYFWLRYKTGFIQVGRRGEAQAFLAWQDGAPLSVRYLGLASNGWRSNWRICENMAVMH